VPTLESVPLPSFQTVPPPRPSSPPVLEVQRETEDDGDTAESPVAEPASLRPAGGEGPTQGAEERRQLGIREWVSGRRVAPTQTLLPRPIQIHEAVPSGTVEEELDFIDQIFVDAVFGASEVSEVKRRVEEVVEEVFEELADLGEVTQQDAKVEESVLGLKPHVDHLGLWRNLEAKFEDLPPIYRLAMTWIHIPLSGSAGPR
jgi:hypothetical protein